ncbi:MAG: hypothetical protein LBN05_02330 [Oscillospiraceae bacterium]|jgi:hypothetical protein|nr:hypothetical protein [Oscillospiraceae bacterium]
MNNTTYTRARDFLYRNARPLDFARFQYHFENGSKEAVLNALAAYQNEDGGFGHALEPDAWNPHSSPIQTWTATEILREIGFTDSRHPIIKGILRYLAGGQDFDGEYWDNEPLSNNDYPHAPWWHKENPHIVKHDCNPTAVLAGFIVRFAEKTDDLYALGCQIAKAQYDIYADDAFADEGIVHDGHGLFCYLRMWQYCSDANASDVFNLADMGERLKADVKCGITADKAAWETDYIYKPSFFFNSRDSIFYVDNKDIADYECDFIIRTQQPDGAWPIPWGWADYPEEWAVSKNWWKGNGALLNLLYLQGMGRL